MCFGDGIQDVQITAGGEIWVSYSDEGVFGNYGWGLGSDSPPIGASGLVCFDTNAKKTWSYEAPVGLGPIDDCYALNVGREVIWAYYYSDFPLVRIGRDRQIQAWRTGIGGATAIAVDESRVLFFGGYGDDEHRCLVGELGDLPSMATVTKWDAIGRGPLLHIFAGTSWYQLDVRTLPPG
jgi:hypothetical protein